MIRGSDTFFYLDKGQIVWAIHETKGKPLFIIDFRDVEATIIIEKNSQATYLIDGKVKGQKEAQNVLKELTK